MPAVIHILFFCSLVFPSALCMLTTITTTATAAAAAVTVIDATDTVTSSLIHSFVHTMCTHTHTFHFSCVFAFSFLFTRKTYLLFFCRHLTNIFHFGILYMGKIFTNTTQRAVTMCIWRCSKIIVYLASMQAHIHKRISFFFHSENKIWKKYEFLPIKCDDTQ